MSRYIIVKGPRVPKNLSLESGYAGPSCEEAGVPHGKIYITQGEAEKDAEKLTQVNPVGFLVVKL